MKDARRALKMTAICWLSALALASCHAHKEETSFTYDFTENNCPTGAKSFSDHAAYCASLLDNAANHFCAEDLRLQRYNEECGGGATKASLQTQSDGPAPILSASDAKVEAHPVDSGPAHDAALSQVTIEAHPSTSLETKITASGDSLLVSLSGSLSIDSTTPENSPRLNLVDADAAFSTADLGDCHLIVRNFDAPSAQTINFMLMGNDKTSETSSSSCSSRLQQMAAQGFTVQLKNVLAGGALNQIRIPMVLLKVQAN